MEGKVATRLCFAYDGLNRLISSAANGGPADVFAYDAVGNITRKGAVQGYVYGQNGAGPHAVTTAQGVSYSYDANGNLLSRSSGSDATALQWTGFGMVEKMVRGTNHSVFWFGAGNERVVQIDSAGGTTHYVGSSYEYIKDMSGHDIEKCYVMTPGGRVAVRTVNETLDTVETRYLHQDALGSVYAVTDESGALERRMTYDPWGAQSVRFQAPGSDKPTRRGFTDHEMLPSFDLIHMNGRIYDPRIGRFCSADPVLEDPTNAQTYNRYSYVRNSPLVHIDPSGYSSWSDFFRQLVQLDYKLMLGPFYSNDSVRNFAVQGRSAAAGIIVGIYAGPAAGGAVAGWMQGFEGSLLNGGSLGAAFRSGVTGAAIGAAVGGVTGAIGDASKLTNFQRALAHGAVGGAVAELQGGKFAHGFASSFAGSYLSVGNSGSTVSEKIGSTVYAAVVGGTVSVIGGGKFANGAATAAFQHVLNQLTHRERARINSIKATVTPFSRNPEDMENLRTSSENILEFIEGWFDHAVGFPIGPVEMMSGLGTGPGEMMLAVSDFMDKVVQLTRGSSLWVEVSYQRRGRFGWKSEETQYRPVMNHTSLGGGANQWSFQRSSDFNSNGYAIARYMEELRDVIGVMGDTFKLE